MTLKVIMFPGQGSQFQGMGEQLFKEFPDTVAVSNHALGYDIADICLNNPDNKLNQTTYTQPALFLINYLTHQNHIQENKNAPA